MHCKSSGSGEIVRVGAGGAMNRNAPGVRRGQPGTAQSSHESVARPMSMAVSGMSPVCSVRDVPGPDPIPSPPSPPGVFGKLALEKRLPARFTRKDRLFNNLNLKVLHRRYLEEGRAARGGGRAFFFRDCEFRIAKLRELICKRALVQIAEEKHLQNYFRELGLTGIR